MSCNECMKGSPYKFCCRLECGEHEFCRNCSYISNNKYCPYKTEQMLQYSKEELNNKPEDFYNSIKPIPIDWSTVKPLPPVEDSNLIPIEKTYEEGDFYAIQFHCNDGSYNETRTAICFNDFQAACEWVDSHDDERYEIVPQKFGCEFVNHWD